MWVLIAWVAPRAEASDSIPHIRHRIHPRSRLLRHRLLRPHRNPIRLACQAFPPAGLPRTAPRHRADRRRSRQ